MDENIIDKVKTFLIELGNKFIANITDLQFLLQISIAALILIICAFINKLIRKFLSQKFNKLNNILATLLHIARIGSYQIITIIALFFTKKILAANDASFQVIAAINSVIVLWLVIRISADYIKQQILKRIIYFFAVVYVILQFLGLWSETIEILKNTAFTLAETKISILMILQAIILLLILRIVSKGITQFAEEKLKQSQTLNSSLQVLIIKTTRVALFIITFLIIISYLGIKLTAFAIFTGAIGVGVGFGLQTVVSNIISGIILLMDNSIKPNDMIEIEGTYGKVKKLGSRYTAVVSIDGREFIIPNEYLISNTVINWSHSDNLVRLTIPVGVSYNENMHQVKEILLSIVNEFERILSDPPPKVLMTEFGDSSVNFSLNLWISDPQKGIKNIQSDIMFTIWDKFKEAGIEIPFPQRDLHIRSSEPNFKIKQSKDDTN